MPRWMVCSPGPSGVASGGGSSTTTGISSARTAEIIGPWSAQLSLLPDALRPTGRVAGGSWSSSMVVISTLKHSALGSLR
eukprot:CAMPEP_0206507718 /NCGR_PEP_ID=MMETSP0324_2-20121206/57737_1 /ASSEMBLY_ACC=CAM_ASM_000836 /TAXON_ID=2866 /ORGANISM="Crypthecodinium cohnii, Strain Seligo" /LENGTH=79 /DNA_ID=CAMNT_0053998111 /DNA_START=752 /DNA_END=987 /DNA_ORIENTATION=-